MEKLNFASDYVHGAHPEILRRLEETNLEGNPGYGTDRYCESAKEKIRTLCEAPEAEIYFLTGGTQTNAAVISGLLRPWQGVIAAETGHIACHEAGAVELTGHKVLTVPATDGKLSAADAEALLRRYAEDGNREHTVAPGLIYLSQPTEAGTLYSRTELTALRKLCDRYGIRLYLDGARLAYALGSKENDVSLPELARLCDAFYLGGTKCGALFGEAVITPKRGTLPHFFSQMKQRGAVMAKGWLLGLQFDTLLQDGLYEKLGRTAVERADRLRIAMKELGYVLAYENPTNQVFAVVDRPLADRLAERIRYEVWEQLPKDQIVIRLVVSWATDDSALEKLICILRKTKE